MSLPDRPQLRNVEVSRARHNGTVYFALSDPTRFSHQTLLVPEPLGMYLALADGSRTLPEIASAAVVRGAPMVPPGGLRDMFTRLDEALLLQNGAYALERARRLDEYRSAPHRPPALAGLSYPAGVDELRKMLNEFEPDGPTAAPAPAERLKAIISPHIDYQRGGHSYATVWRRAAPHLQDVDLAVIFGTDHNGPGPRLTLTRQPYATPFGVLPADAGLVSRLAEALNADPSLEDHAFTDEFNHIGEHSVELAAVWLHHATGGRPVTVLPVLCGSLHEYWHAVEGTAPRPGTPADEPHIAAAVDILREEAARRRTVFIAAADLAHTGPAFGDAAPVGAADRDRVRDSDARLMDLAVRGNRDGLLAAIRSVSDADRVCGVAPLYLALWSAGASEGEWMGYRQCPADSGNGSFVSVAGALLYEP